MAWKKILLEGEAAVLSNTPPVDVDTAVADEGTASEASRQDHKHDVGDMTGMTADTILEKTSNAGVTIDGCLIKDGLVADSNLLEGSNKAAVQNHSVAGLSGLLDDDQHVLDAEVTAVIEATPLNDLAEADGVIACGQQQLDGLVPESAASAPDSGTEVAGQLYYNTGDKHIYQWVPA